MEQKKKFRAARYQMLHGPLFEDRCLSGYSQLLNVRQVKSKSLI